MGARQAVEDLGAQEFQANGACKSKPGFRENVPISREFQKGR
jgi:hypothetical protein